MDLHKPRAARSWREFLVEIGTIVCGILIALGLEQGVEALRRSSAASEARANLDAEISADITRMNQRVINQACIDRRLDELDALLDTAGPDGRIARPRSIGNPPRYAMESDRWDAASHSGQISLLTPDEQARLSLIYTEINYWFEMENGEQLVWARLRALENSDRLTPDGLLTMRSVLQEARFYDHSIKQVGRGLLRLAGSRGLHPSSRNDGPKTVCFPMTRPANDFADFER